MVVFGTDGVSPTCAGFGSTVGRRIGGVITMDEADRPAEKLTLTEGA